MWPLRSANALEVDGTDGEQGVDAALLVEVAFADDVEVAGWVETRCGVADEVGRPELVDVPVAVDADVIGDIDPPLIVLVVSLVLAETSRGVAVVTEDHGGVVNRDASDGVGSADGAGAVANSPSATWIQLVAMVPSILRDQRRLTW